LSDEFITYYNLLYKGFNRPDIPLILTIRFNIFKYSPTVYLTIARFLRGKS